MQDESASALRARAQLARRLAGETHGERARRELLEIADDLQAEADKIDEQRSGGEEPS